MRIPIWIWIILGLSAINLFIPDGIPLIDEIALPAIAVGSLLLRRYFMKNFYQKQYQNYQSVGGRTSQGSFKGTSQGSSQGTGSFYNRFKGWGSGYQQPGVSTEKDPYNILGVGRGASINEIKKAYRNKLKKFHPDIVENLKLGQEYREMFEDKTREIKNAYEKLGGK